MKAPARIRREQAIGRVCVVRIDGARKARTARNMAGAGYLVWQIHDTLGMSRRAVVRALAQASTDIWGEALRADMRRIQAALPPEMLQVAA